jgi:hypothetical protein
VASGQASGFLSVQPQSSTKFLVVVTAQDKTTQRTYTVNATALYSAPLVVPPSEPSAPWHETWEFGLGLALLLAACMGCLCYAWFCGGTLDDSRRSEADKPGGDERTSPMDTGAAAEAGLAGVIPGTGALQTSTRGNSANEASSGSTTMELTTPTPERASAAGPRGGMVQIVQAGSETSARDSAFDRGSGDSL